MVGGGGGDMSLPPYHVRTSMHINSCSIYPSTHVPYLVLRQLTQHQERCLVALGASLEHIDQLCMWVVLDILPIHLQQYIPLRQLGTARVVHDKLHHWTNLRLTYGKYTVKLKTLTLRP